jgi:hypothetical protein
MRLGRPGRWTERAQGAGSDSTHTPSSRLRALSCVDGVGVRVSLGASRIPAIRRLSRRAQQTGAGETLCRASNRHHSYPATAPRESSNTGTCSRLASKRRGPAGDATSARRRPPAAEAGRATACSPSRCQGLNSAAPRFRERPLPQKTAGLRGRSAARAPRTDVARKRLSTGLLCRPPGCSVRRKADLPACAAIDRPQQ